MDEQLELINKIEAEFKVIIQTAFPENFIRRWGSSGPRFDASFATENRYFKNTEYYYNESLQFFHLTSLQNLFSIINSRNIRLYNLHNSSDPEEYSFAASQLELTQNQIDYRKSNIYTFSFCPFNDLSNVKIWETYGRNFTGAAIVFEINNDIDKWNNFHLSKLHYSLSPKISQYVQDIKLLKLKYPNCTFYLNLEKLLGFHKTENWAKENEVRILTYSPYDLQEERLKFINKELKIETGRNRFTEYINMPLWVDNSSRYLECSENNLNLDRRQILPTDDFFTKQPKIKINNILFGENCGLTPSEYRKFKFEIENMFKYNYGYILKMDENMYHC